jgi:hypothetical protein
MFNSLSAKTAGAKGGLAKSKAKGKAARANGKLGGCPPTKTFAEKLLGRTIHPGQLKYIEKALCDMLASERREFQGYFQLEGGMSEAMSSAAWKSKSRRTPKQIQYLIKKFRLAANYYLRDVPMPKPYLVESQPRSLGAQELWHRNHRDSRIPCPPLKLSTDVRRLPDFRLIEFKHRNGVTWTVNDLMEISGQWTKKRAEVAIKWLNATYPPGGLQNKAGHQGGKVLP